MQPDVLESKIRKGESHAPQAILRVLPPCIGIRGSTRREENLTMNSVLTDDKTSPPPTSLEHIICQKYRASALANEDVGIRGDIS